MNRVIKSEKNQTCILVAAAYSGATTRWHYMRGSKSLNDESQVLKSFQQLLGTIIT